MTIRPTSRRSAAILALVWVTGGAYAWAYLDRGWVPHDEGALAQSAERVHGGELPHADFDEIYTGGLSYAHALAFEAFGVRLIALRYALFALLLAWIPVVFWLAAKFAPPWLSGLVTALAVAIGVPNYSAAVPSWYVLFLSTFALAAALRFDETGRRRWLVIAGACAGLATLVKVVGLYALAALLAWVAFHDQIANRARAGEPTGRGYSAMLTAGVGVSVAAVAALILRHPGPAQYVQFLLPAAAVGTFLIHEEWRVPRPRLTPRARGAGAAFLPLAAGFALPLVPFLARYAADGSLGALARGVFLDPQRRFEHATFPFPAWRYAPWALAPTLLVLWARRWPSGGWGRPALFVVALLAAVLIVSDSPSVYRAVWGSLRWSIPVLVVLGLAALARDPGGAPGGTPAGSAGSEPFRAGRFALIAAASLLTLIQFPFAAPVYFLYVAPLALLAAAAIVPPRPGARAAFGILVSFYLIFAVARIAPGFIYGMGHVYRPVDRSEPLDLPRAGLRVTAADRETYERLVPLVEERAGDGAIWAGPDSPEVYFLAGWANPTRTLFDFTAGSPPSPAERVRALERAGVRVVVLNEEPGFSAPVDEATRRALAMRWPHVEQVGPFEVRWRP